MAPRFKKINIPALSRSAALLTLLIWFWFHAEAGSWVVGIGTDDSADAGRDQQLGVAVNKIKGSLDDGSDHEGKATLSSSVSVDPSTNGSIGSDNWLSEATADRETSSNSPRRANMRKGIQASANEHEDSSPTSSPASTSIFGGADMDDADTDNEISDMGPYNEFYIYTPSEKELAPQFAGQPPVPPPHLGLQVPLEPMRVRPSGFSAGYTKEASIDDNGVTASSSIIASPAPVSMPSPPTANEMATSIQRGAAETARATITSDGRGVLMNGTSGSTVAKAEGQTTKISANGGANLAHLNYHIPAQANRSQVELENRAASEPQTEKPPQQHDQQSDTGSGANGKADDPSDWHKRPYCIGNKFSRLTFNWVCQGPALLQVPVNLEPKPVSLRLLNTGLERLERDSLDVYKETLRDFSIENAPKLTSIEPETFGQLRKLRVVYIQGAAKLLSFDFAVSGLHPELTIMRIHQTGLRSWPDLSHFRQERLLTSFGLDNNNIETLGTRPINIRAELLNLEFNRLSFIDEFTFNGSEIGVLSLNGNRQLSHIHENAFANLKNLVRLDLSSTSISQLPTIGLQHLTHLIVRDTFTLKHIPSIYAFPSLREAHLTYAYHCCSFRYPQTHDPMAHEQHLKLQEEINTWCANNKQQRPPAPGSLTETRPNLAGGSDTATMPPVVSQNNGDWEGFFDPQVAQAPAAADFGRTETSPLRQSEQQPRSGLDDQLESTSDSHHQQTARAINATDRADLVLTTSTLARSQSQPHMIKDKLGIPYNIECGELVNKETSYSNITCTPEPDAFNPCEDIMGYSILRFAVWLVVGASVLGNLSVIVVLAGVFKRLSVPKFLQLNLALGDLFMGVYLSMLAFADVTTVGKYFNYAIDWQHGLGCNVAGAASLFASQLSIFTLSVITFERYYTITYSIDLNMRLQLGWAARIMLVGWLFAFVSAMLPVYANINSYSKTSICLPMRTTYPADKYFIFVLLFIDASAFVIIFGCYLKMYLLILGQKTQATAKERTVAARMALLVFTDFVCWAPIIFFALTALFGHPLISVTNSKILIVFFYPLNSVANPFLYVISTRAYRRDLNYLQHRLFAWRKGLFGKNIDGFYGRQQWMTGQHPNALNAHLGAVASMTGVAHHLHHYQLSATKRNHNHNHKHNHHHHHHHHYRHHHPALANHNNSSDSSTADGIRLHEQRVICTKGHKGNYIIRHQILTGKRSPPLLSGPKMRANNMIVSIADDQKSATSSLENNRRQGSPKTNLRNASRAPSLDSTLQLARASDEGRWAAGRHVPESNKCDGVVAIIEVTKMSEGENHKQEAACRKGSKAKSGDNSSSSCSRSWHQLCTERLSSRCCRCCPGSHLCRLSKGSLRSNSSASNNQRPTATGTTALTEVIPSIGGDNQASAQGAHWSGEAPDLNVDSNPNDETSPTNRPAKKAQNLCRLAARESDDLKTIALVSPMQYTTISSPPNESLASPIINCSADGSDGLGKIGEGRKRYSSLVDDIFRDALEAGVKRASLKRQSIDILGNLSINEPTSTTTNSSSDERRNIIVADEKGEARFLVKEDGTGAYTTKREQTPVDSDDHCSCKSRGHRSQCPHEQPHRHRRHHHHHHRHRRHHHHHSHGSCNAEAAARPRAQPGGECGDKCDRRHQSHPRLRRDTCQVQSDPPTRNKGEEDEDGETEQMPMPIVVQSDPKRKEIESILRVRQSDLDGAPKDGAKKQLLADSFQRVGSLLGWKRSNESEKTILRASSSFKGSSRNFREKKKVSIIDHHSG